MAVTAKKIEQISKALGDSHRLKILMHLSKKGGCGQCADIQQVISLTQPSVSHHIKILVGAGLIEPTKQGRNYKYTINGRLLNDYVLFLTQLKS